MTLDTETPFGRLAGWLRGRRRGAANRSAANGTALEPPPAGPRREGADEAANEAANPLLGAPEASERLTGRRGFHDRFYDLARAKRNWQLMAFAATALALYLAVSYVQLASSARITPYVVEVNELGVARAFGPAERITVDDRVTTAAIAEFITNARRITSDPQTQRELILEAYAFADTNARQFLDAYYSRPENDPRLLATRLRRTIHLESILRMPDADGGEATSWQVRWIERDRPIAGGTALRSAWEAVLRVHHVPPATTASMTTNPLGIYITDINWSIINVEGGSS